MSLTALQIRAFSPGATASKVADQRGLYLEIFPIGSKLWRLKARWFLDLLKPKIGHMPISDVDSQMMLAPAQGA